jgi:hypothetical protein
LWRRLRDLGSATEGRLFSPEFLLLTVLFITGARFHQSRITHGMTGENKSIDSGNNSGQGMRHPKL